jgi:A/G-specific adenine glycosylase
VLAPADPGPAISPDAVEAILAWYASHGRELEFRRTRDPYAVLVAELMAQQTQAARAAEAWSRWVARWPTVADLAAATVADVVRAWAGLGYNRRAINLHRAAQAIVRDHRGQVPASVAALEALPGVGPYTARAVAATAFGIAAGAVDTNVRRVLGRIVAGDPDAVGAARMQALADAVVPADRPVAWTHALMDLGAGPCRPRRPRCADCPIVAWCAYAAGVRPPADEADRRPRRTEPPFPTTRRWLRGRILALARGAPDGAWVGLAEPIGQHPSAAVREAALALAADGLLETRDGPAGPECRLPGLQPLPFEGAADRRSPSSR